jgi:hypothetical protein
VAGQVGKFVASAAISKNFFFYYSQSNLLILLELLGTMVSAEEDEPMLFILFIGSFQSTICFSHSKSKRRNILCDA